MPANDFIDLAISEMSSPNSSENLNVLCRKYISLLETDASCSLNNFDFIPDKSDKEIYRLEPRPAIPAHTVYMANNLWESIGGKHNPMRAFAVMRAACIEFSRCQFASFLTAISFSNASWALGAWMRREAKIVPELMRTTPWTDANNIARNPHPPTWFMQTATFEFEDWLNSTEPNQASFTPAHNVREPLASMNPIPNEVQLMSSIALLWIDESICNRSKASYLWTEIVEIFGILNFKSGWDARGEFESEENSSFAKKGAEARHAGNNQRRAAIIAAYKAGNFPSKDTAAEELSRQFSTSWRTAREHLKGI